MTIEEALVNELNSITELKDKIYPLVADEGTSYPYVVFVSEGIKRYKTLSGFLPNGDINIEIHIVADSYFKIKELSKKVDDKVITFLGRVVGGNGPFIQNLDYEETQPETYAKEVQGYIRIMNLKLFFSC
ncbi:MAG: hypothetical protein ACRC7N_07065 [Clostridium sp.]